MRIQLKIPLLFSMRFSVDDHRHLDEPFPAEQHVLREQSAMRDKCGILPEYLLFIRCIDELNHDQIIAPPTFVRQTIYLHLELLNAVARANFGSRSRVLIFFTHEYRKSCRRSTFGQSIHIVGMNGFITDLLNTL